MFSIQFTLKQQTPIIHFQHEQEGATLRASEMKPKLDRFIINKIGKENIDKNWYNNYEKNSLNYKLTFISEKLSDYILTTYIPRKPIDPQKIRENILYQEDLREQKINFIDEVGYFADSDKISKKNYNNIKKGITYKNVRGKITSNYSLLLKELYHNLSDFFIIESFGCRTSKGFGSFTIDSINDSNSNYQNFQNAFKQNRDIIAVYKSDFENKPSFEKILKAIKTDAQILRSGLNNPGKSYVKSLLFIYFCERFKKKWDKRWIKKQMGSYYSEKTKDPINCDCTNNTIPYPENEYLFERVVLGLPETNEYRLSTNKKLIIEIKETANNIERYKAPLTFKVIDSSIILIVYKSYNLILNKSFEFKLFRKDGDTKVFLKEFPNLRAPDNSFKLVEFLDWAFNYIKDIDEENLVREEFCQDDLLDYYFQYNKIYELID